MIERFLIWCSGAQVGILYNEAPTDRTKHVGIGGTVLLTALLAILSGGYAMHLTFQTVWVSIPFGIFWGAIIFNLDRYIVSSMKKTGNWQEEVSFAVPRFLLALVLAVVVSKPIELRLFQDSIQTQFHATRSHDVRAAIDRVGAKQTELEAKRDTLLKKFKGAGELVTKDPELKESGARVQQQSERVQSIQGTIAQNQRQINANMVVVGYDSLGTPQWGPNSTARALIRTNRALQVQLKQVREVRDSLDRANSKLGNDLANNSQGLRNALQAQIVAQDSLIARWRDVDGPAMLKADIEGLSKTIDLPAQIAALSKLSANNSDVRGASWLITLLFILLECSPVIVKLLSKRGPYDEVLARMEYEVELAQKKIVSDLNDEINNRLKEVQELNKLAGEVRLSSERAKLDAELKANEALLQQIAAHQADLAKIAVDKWYKQEKARLEQDPDVRHVQGAVQTGDFLIGPIWKVVHPIDDLRYVFMNGSSTTEQTLIHIQNKVAQNGTWRYDDPEKGTIAIDLPGGAERWCVEELSPNDLKFRDNNNALVVLQRI